MGKPRNQVSKPCGTCGKIVTRCASQMFKNAFCDNVCAKQFRQNNMKTLNAELNTSRMIPEVRMKLRESKLGTGAGKTYEKFFGVHRHRVEAEQMLGRKLFPGEVVHHIDENIRNNDPSNLMVFKSQKEHAAWHMAIRSKKVNDDL